MKSRALKCSSNSAKLNNTHIELVSWCSDIYIVYSVTAPFLGVQGWPKHICSVASWGIESGTVVVVVWGSGDAEIDMKPIQLCSAAINP